MTPKSLIEPARHAGTALLRSQTDARLVDLTRDGNDRAFEAIVQRYRRPLLRYCSRLLPAARAEDALQQAFLSAHRAIHAGDAELNLRPWLYRIAHNASLNLLRQHGFDHEQVTEEIDGVDTPPQIFERGERLRTVVAAVRDLPPRQRDAIVLQAMEGRSYDEIAAELGVSDGAVRQLLNRARNTLREAAAALTPTGLLSRVASSGGEAGMVDRVAQAVTGAGGGALLAKAGATLVVAGAVAGGAATGTLPGTGAHRTNPPRSAAAAQQPSGAGNASVFGTAGARRADVLVATGPSGRSNGARGALTGPHGSGAGGKPGGRHGGGSDGASGGSGSGSSSSGPGDRHSGSDGGGDHSGSGSLGSGDRHSGSDGGGDHSGSGSSGSSDSSPSSGSSGSGDGGSSGPGGGHDHSGSGSSGSGSSGSGSSASPAPVTTVPTTSGHDRSGSGGSDNTPEPPDGSGGSGKSH